MDLGSFNKIPLNKRQEEWFALQELKNSVGCCLLIVGGVLAVSLPPVLGIYAVLPVISFWLCGSWLILDLAITTPKLSKEEIENLRWEEYLRRGDVE